MIEVSHLAIERDQIPILRDINLSIAKGELIALLGPSGAGKSTLLRAIAGLEAFSSGSIGFCAAHYPKIAMVFQDYALFPHLTVEENLQAALDGDTMPKRKTPLSGEFIVRILRIQTLLSSKPHEISAGQRQRVGLARALLVNPDIVLLDEPFANLDEQTKKDLNGGLRAVLLRRGITAILVTHDFDEAQVFADRVGVLLAGTIVQIDRPSRIYDEPVNRVVGEFIGDLVPIEAKREGTMAHCAFGTVAIIDEDQEAAKQGIGEKGELYARLEDFYLEESGLVGEVVSFIFHGEDTTATLRFAEFDDTIDIRVFWPTTVRIGDQLKVGLKKRPYKLGPLMDS